MYASFHQRDLTCADLFRDFAAACAGILGAIWVALFVNEMIREQALVPNVHSYMQFGALAVVFAAYIVGWRHGVLGVTLAVAGTVALFVFGYASVGTMPPLAVAWFVVPGVLYLLAWIADRRKQAAAIDNGRTVELRK